MGVSLNGGTPISMKWDDPGFLYHQDKVIPWDKVFQAPDLLGGWKAPEGVFLRSNSGETTTVWMHKTPVVNNGISTT